MYGLFVFVLFLIALRLLAYFLTAVLVGCLIVYSAFGGHIHRSDGRVLVMDEHLRKNVALPIIRCVFAGLALVALLVVIF